MTTHFIKTWFDGENIVTQEIPVGEVYKQESVAYAGVKVWIGNQQIVKHLTQTELHYATEPWLLVELNALKCVAALKEKNT